MGTLKQQIHNLNLNKDAIAIWWIGQSGFLIKSCDYCLLIDPYLSDSVTKHHEGTSRPHNRIEKIVINPSELGIVDTICVTHAHMDHFDAETIVLILENNIDAKVVVPNGIINLAKETLAGHNNILPISLDKPLCFDDLDIRAIPAAHEEIRNDEDGNICTIGYRIKIKGLSLYHSGDTIYFDKLSNNKHILGADIALLPINGRGKGVTGNMWGREAAKLAKEINAELTIPMHFGMFDFNTETPTEFIESAKSLGVEFKILKVGDYIVLKSNY